jgi:hypothetical protein
MGPLEDEHFAGQVLTLAAAATLVTEFRGIKADAYQGQELGSMWGVDIWTVLAWMSNFPSQNCCHPIRHKSRIFQRYNPRSSTSFKAGVQR